MQFVDTRFSKNHALYNRLRDAQGLALLPDTYDVAVQPEVKKKNWFAVGALVLAGAFVIVHLFKRGRKG